MRTARDELNSEVDEEDDVEEDVYLWIDIEHISDLDRLQYGRV